MINNLATFSRRCRREWTLRNYETMIPWTMYVDQKPGRLAGTAVNVVVKSIVNGEINAQYLPSDWNFSKIQYLTYPKRLVIDVVGRVVSDLRGGGFVGHSGSASRLVYGEKGIGKSSAFRLAVMGTWLCYDDVIPIYLEYIGNTNEFKAPSEVLANIMKLPVDTSLGDCLDELKKRNKFALIICDEIEQVYTDMDLGQKRRLILDDLAALGSQRSGRTYTFICGNSSLVPLLISKNAVYDDNLVKEFPFVSLAPKLNGSKYSGFHVHREVHGKEDLDILMNSYKLNMEAANLVHYLCGSNLRSVDRVIRELRDLGKQEDSDQEGVLKSISEGCVPIHQWDQSKRRTFDEDGELINDLLDKMVKVNELVVANASRSSVNVPKINWFTDVVPLNHDEILSVCCKHNIPNCENAINLLIDKGYFSGPPGLEYLYPNKPSELVSHYQYAKLRRSNVRLNTIKGVLGKVPNCLRNHFESAVPSHFCRDVVLVLTKFMQT